MLFADLVGFTAIAEKRDPEEVRDILSMYFDRMRELVSRHGGIVEKFIGDAVMAVWGTPVAHEDDAERAVRAGLAMTTAVTAMNRELELPEETLALRVGVLTGEAAITVGAEGQGMVAGDLVNTASRVQSTAPPGWVLVDEPTRRATESAVAFEEAGIPMLKGKSSSIPVLRALRVVAGRRGSGRAVGLEAPFVGRDEELRQVIDLFHVTARDGKARLVSVTGVAGIGKSRLAWEFEKYVDGLVDTVLWHRGRCLAYGEGVTYWALAEMLRMRAGILEDEPSESAAAKLREAVTTAVSDGDERDWVEPRLAHLLGLDAPAGLNRQDLFAAWRLFFERLSDAAPVAMVFEDLQWADSALLDFIEYVLDWSRNRPIFVLTLARPELAERRPGWGTSARAFTSLFLEPLSSQAMEHLVRGLVPGLPDDLVDRVRDRAEGVPLYAVETVRMLLDRGLIRREESRYVVAGDVDTLHVPETLQSLIAARLDGLSEKERALLRDASVLGKTFGREALAAVTGWNTSELDEVLSSLARKELFGVDSDPRSPERGQYGFLQALVREVAYQTLSKKERKARHLAVARYLQSDWPEEEEVVQIVASHYLEAFHLAPEASDAPEVETKARESLSRAGDRAASLGASGEARRYFEKALELVRDPLERAGLTRRAGEMAWADGQADDAIASLEQAFEVFESRGEVQEAARTSARLSQWLWNQNRIDEALDGMESAYAVLSKLPPDESFARVASELARLYFFRGNVDAALEKIEETLMVAEGLLLTEVLSQALNTKALALAGGGRHGEEGLALLQRALALAEENRHSQAALRAYNNLFLQLRIMGRNLEANRIAGRGLELARKLGDRLSEWHFILHIVHSKVYSGDWDEALRSAALIPHPEETPGSRWTFGWSLVLKNRILVNRGEMGEAERNLQLLEGLFGESHDTQTRSGMAAARVLVLAAQGEHGRALDQAERAFHEGVEVVGFDTEVRDAFVQAVESALELGDLAHAKRLVDLVGRRLPGELPPGVRGQLARFRALLASARGEAEAVELEFKAAETMIEECDELFDLAVVRLEHAEWLAGRGEQSLAQRLLSQAQETFERLRATPWLERAAGLGSAEAQVGV